MGFWSWLTGRPPERGVLTGDNEFAFHVVGTSFHQTALDDLCGPRRAFITAAPRCSRPSRTTRTTVTQSPSPFTALRVGHLERDVAPDFLAALRRGGFADAATEALIVGGWDRGGHDRGYFGVRLNAYMPFECVTAEVYERRRHPHQG
jgi:hypothetical protein